jgi:hypothetical protein
MGKTLPHQELETVSRWEYREILLARMAGGDLYANEILLKVRRIDKALDLFRETPLYGKRSRQND